MPIESFQKIIHNNPKPGHSKWSGFINCPLNLTDLTRPPGAI